MKVNSFQNEDEMDPGCRGTKMKVAKWTLFHSQNGSVNREVEMGSFHNEIEMNPVNRWGKMEIVNWLWFHFVISILILEMKMKPWLYFHFMCN